MKISFSYPASRINIPINTPKCTVLVPMSSLTAQIVEVREHYETNVTSSGGGGWVSNGSGYIRPPRIHSQTVRVERVWLRDPAIRDRCETLHNSSLEPRVGQYLTTIFGHDQTVLYRYNHSAGRLEHSDKQVRSYLHRCIPASEFIKNAATITPLLVVSVLIYLLSLRFFPPIITRLIILAVLVQIFPLIQNCFVKYRSRDQEINATMLELKKAVRSIPTPQSASGV